MLRRQRSQSLVEFGIVALLFTLLMFAIVDFGLLLNTWVRLSSATREVARGAAVGDNADNVRAMVTQLVLPGVTQTADPSVFTGYCCGDGGEYDKIDLSVTYYDQCIPGRTAGGCTAVPPGQVDQHFWGGTCPSCPLHPRAGDTIEVSLSAPGMELVTPLVRPFFGCSGSTVHCYVKLGSTALMRVEGR